MHKQNIKLRDIRIVMIIINFIAVLYVSLFVYRTTDKICDGFMARDFLNTVVKVPDSPGHMVVMAVGMFMLLLTSILVREKFAANNSKIAYGTLVFDFFISFVLVGVLNFNYNGILLLVFTGVISYAKGEKGKYLMISLALASFLLTDRELMSINYKLYSVLDYMSVYDASMQQKLIGIYNILPSLNIILFIIYCIMLIQEQKGTIDEVNMLYDEIRKTNNDLKNANEQLEKYAKITERMGETKERNRLAREIHDTLGHTLTGVSVGIDACIATVEQAPAETKKHLELISGVVRNGLLDIRRSVNELKPDALDRLSLDVAITKMITDMKDITDMQIFFECRVTPLKFDEDEESAIYRVVQESLTNAMRHGRASKVWVTMELKEGNLLLTICDNGIGCTNIEPGFGTRHIKERISLLNGTVEFKSGNGFTVSARIPIRWGEEYD